MEAYITTWNFARDFSHLARCRLVGHMVRGQMCCKGSQITLLMGIMVKVEKRGHKEQGKYGKGSLSWFLEDQIRWS